MDTIDYYRSYAISTRNLLDGIIAAMGRPSVVMGEGVVE